MRVVERCREHLRERGVAFNEDTKFGVMLSVPAACLTAEEFVEHGVDFLVVGTNDLTSIPTRQTGSLPAPSTTTARPARP